MPRTHGHTFGWCQFRNYIHPLGEIDTKKITRPSPFESNEAGGLSTSQRCPRSLDLHTTSFRPASIGSLVTSETAY